MSQQRILIVDDDPANIRILAEILKPEYKISAATDGKDALSLAQGRLRPDLILLDIMMPGMDGYEVCRRLKEKKQTRDMPVLFVTAAARTEEETKGLEYGAVDYITKPINPAIVRARVRNQMHLKQHQERLEELVRERTRELSLTQDATIYSLATLAEYRDPETGGHIKRTQNYVRAMAEHLRGKPSYRHCLNDSTINLLYKSAPLHDIGKVGIKDSILLKPGKLNASEFEAMKKHTAFGRAALRAAEKTLGSNSFLKVAREVSYTHHEKWDGSGYPKGLAGEDIPVSGRLMAVADVYDALISKRVYKSPMAHGKAVDIIVAGRGKHFDPDMVDAFMTMDQQFRSIALKFADHKEEKSMLAA